MKKNLLALSLLLSSVQIPFAHAQDDASRLEKIRIGAQNIREQQNSEDFQRLKRPEQDLYLWQTMHDMLPKDPSVNEKKFLSEKILERSIFIMNLVKNYTENSENKDSSAVAVALSIFAIRSTPFIERALVLDENQSVTPEVYDNLIFDYAQEMRNLAGLFLTFELEYKVLRELLRCLAMDLKSEKNPSIDKNIEKKAEVLEYFLDKISSETKDSRLSISLALVQMRCLYHEFYASSEILRKTPNSLRVCLPRIQNRLAEVSSW